MFSGCTNESGHGLCSAAEYATMMTQHHWFTVESQKVQPPESCDKIRRTVHTIRNYRMETDSSQSAQQKNTPLW